MSKRPCFYSGNCAVRAKDIWTSIPRPANFARVSMSTSEQHRTPLFHGIEHIVRVSPSSAKVPHPSKPSKVIRYECRVTNDACRTLNRSTLYRAVSTQSTAMATLGEYDIFAMRSDPLLPERRKSPKLLVAVTFHVRDFIIIIIIVIISCNRKITTKPAVHLPSHQCSSEYVSFSTRGKKFSSRRHVPKGSQRQQDSEEHTSSSSPPPPSASTLTLAAM